MAESISDLDSDTSSVESAPTDLRALPSGALLQQLNKRIESLQQENRVLRMELDTYRYKCKSLEEENRELKKARVTIQLMAEQQEEYISNTLLKKIQALKNEKEQLARNYEQEEEFLTNDLSRKLFQLRQEKCELEVTLEKEQEYQVNKLMRRIEKLQAEVVSKQATLEQLKKDKVELENQLEQEQEALVNRLWKRMDKLEAEKRMLQQKLDQPVSAPPSPRDPQAMIVDGDTANNLVQNIQALKAEVARLQNQLKAAQTEHKEKIVQYAEEERHIREENLRLQRKLQMEIERREQLCRHLSESESSLEMDDERHFNEMTKHQEKMMAANVMPPHVTPTWSRTGSSPVPVQGVGISRPISPALHLGPSSPMRTNLITDRLHMSQSMSTTAMSVASQANTNAKLSQSADKFVKPSAPPPQSSAIHHPPATPQSSAIHHPHHQPLMSPGTSHVN